LGPLRGFEKGLRKFDVEGSTVRALIDELDSGRLKEIITDAMGAPLSVTRILVNDENVSSLDGLDTGLDDDDIVSILLIVPISGG